MARPFLLALWVGAIYAAYFAVHKPLPAGFASLAAANLSALFSPTPAGLWPEGLTVVAGWGGAAGTLGLGLLLGRLLARLVGRADWSVPEWAGLGFIILGGIGLVLASAGLGRAGNLRLAAGLLAGVGLAGLLAGGVRGGFNLQRPPMARLGWWSVAAGLAFGLPLAAVAAAPPFEWDTLVYHLSVARVMLETGRYPDIPGAPHFYFPKLGETVYAWAFALGGERAPRILALFVTGLTVWAAWRLARRLGAPPGLSIALLATVPSALELATWAYTDYWVSLWLVLAVGALLSRDRVGLGLWAGAALGTKLTAVGFIAVLGLLGLPAGLRAVPAAGLVAFPWYLDTWVRTGNPVYPFLFGGVGWTPERAAWWGGGPDLARLMRLAAAPVELSTLATAGTLSYDFTLGPVWLATFPALFSRRGTGSEGIRTVAWFLAGSFVYWLGLGAFSANLMQGRLLFPVLPVAAVLWARAIGGFRWGFFLRGAVVIVGAVNLVSLWAGLLAGPVVGGGLGLVPAADFYDRVLGSYYRAVVAAAGPDAAPAVLVWEPRAYFCLPGCRPDDLIDLWRVSGPDPVETWRSQGFNSVLVSWRGFDYAVQVWGSFSQEEAERVRTRLRSLPVLGEWGPPDRPKYGLYRLR
jgi:hypothetical protein